MRRAANFMIPMSLITLYYALWVGMMAYLLARFPAIQDFFPVGGIGDMVGRNADNFEPLYSSVSDNALAPVGPVRLAIASLGAAILIIPVSWVYFITSRDKEVDQSFAQTIIIMPIVVTGISMIVMDSLALAFSLAGIVAMFSLMKTVSARCRLISVPVPSWGLRISPRRPLAQPRSFCSRAMSGTSRKARNSLQKPFE